MFLYGGKAKVLLSLSVFAGLKQALLTVKVVCIEAVRNTHIHVETL